MFFTSSQYSEQRKNVNSFTSNDEIKGLTCNIPKIWYNYLHSLYGDKDHTPLNTQHVHFPI